MSTTVSTSDGRTLEVHEAGDPTGFPIVHHHGTPGSGLLYAPWSTPGARVIGYDRAGYGGSTRDPGRTIASVADDIAAIADALGLDRFATWGISGGGPHALACAALLGDRVTAVASLAGVAPYPADGLDWLAGMGEDNVVEFHLVLEGEAAYRPAAERDRAEMLGTTPVELHAVFDSLLGDADRAATTGELAEYLHTIMIHGLESSADGWIDDDLAFVAPWGFELDAISCPVLVVQGGDDRFVPRSHGEWLAAHLPGSESWIDDVNGHLTLFEGSVPKVHEWLLQRS